MTPKEKALLLVNKYENVTIEGTEGCFNILKTDAKIFALIAVNEIISIDVLIDEDTWVSKTSYLEFWKEVKKELEKI